MPAPGAARALTVIEVDPARDPRWDALLAAEPQALVYHHPAWLQALQAEYREAPLNLACEDDRGNLVGVLPLLRTSGLLTGSRLQSLPRTTAAGPVASTAEATALLLQAAVTRARALPGTRLRLQVASNTLDASVEGLTRVAWSESYSVALPARPEDLRFGNSRNHGAIKRGVNKAARSGVRVRAAESEAELRAWYRLYLETMRWHAVPPRPYRFFLALWELLRPPGLMRLLVAELEGRLLAGSVLLMFGQTVFYAFNGRALADLSLRPNDALHWRALHDACAEGYRRYDFGEVPVGNEGLARFKRKWATDTAPLYRYYYPPPEKQERVDAVGDSRGGQLARAAWQRLPLRATAHLGDALWRYA
jgi:CelD/BcsL family acetyltransferase involved in cellulose biosynthesis